MHTEVNRSLPKYATRLDALHQALRSDFQRIVASVPLLDGQIVLDVGCGDGFFTSLLADHRVDVIGIDNSNAFLREARATTANDPNVEVFKGDARQLPRNDRSVDVVWSAHSMHSYPDVRQCLREFWRVLRPGGHLAVLESDNIHSVMLSWPPDLELAVRQAEHREIGDEDSYIGTYFPRFASSLLSEIGFEEPIRKYFLIQHVGAASEPLAEFVRLYLENLLERTGELLSEKMRGRLALLANPASDKYLPRQKFFFFGSLQVLVLARKNKAHLGF